MNFNLVLENLTFRYSQDEPEILHGVDLEIGQGEFVAVLGHNGSGKSTLAKHFNAILLPYGGKAYVGGMDTADEGSLLEIRRNVGLVFQNPDNQIVATVVEEDVAFAPENLGVDPKEIRRRVDYALEAVGMSEFKKHAPHQLSGGQKQRVAIAGIIAMAPKVIVLDEPTAMLDPIGREEVMKTVGNICRSENITVVLITHNMEEAAQADRVVVMNSGEIALDGSPREVFSKADYLKSIKLETPQATELAHRLSKEGFDVDVGVLTAEECAAELIRILED